MSFFNSISADGRFVAFDSRCSNLVSGDTKGYQDVFVRDRLNSITERVSVDSSGNQVNGNSFEPAISADGRFVAFSSSAADLVAGDANGHIDVFVHDRSTGITELISVDSSGGQGNGDSHPATISPDGQVVGFTSLATNLDANDNNNYSDVFVHDRASGLTECVSINALGAAGNDDSFSPIALSADGRFATFSSAASDLVAGDNNGLYDVFLRDRVVGVTERVSVDSSGAEANLGSIGASITPNGELVAFASSASNLAGNDTNRVSDAFVRDRCDALWLNYDDGVPGTQGVPAFTAESDPVLGSTLTLDLDNSYGNFTTALLFIGFERASLPTGWGGDLLVVPAFALWIVVPASGASFTGTLPSDPSLCDFAIDLQAFEFDPGAAKAISFTRGLELILGN
jgi:Tol biopolymer transport system component